MAYTDIDRRSDLNIKQDDMLASKRFVIEHKPDSVYFYELEEAIVLDIILDETHPKFANGKLEPDEWPINIDGSYPVPGDQDYGCIGMIKFRFLNSEQGKGKEKLAWAFPIENTGITEWPLMNEIVIVARYTSSNLAQKSYYYSRKLNFKSVVNSNASFMTEKVSGFNDGNINEYTGKEYEGPISKVNSYGGSDYEGVLGNYFKFNPKIRSIKRYEGDTILESRFGSSIRFGAYDDNRNNDDGLNDYEDGGGNPMILIRNRQAPVTNEQGFTAKGYTTENINLDGSSIHATSGKTVSEFLETTKKIMFQLGIKEEQQNYSPDQSTNFEYPKLDGEQIVINSDRLIFSSKANETFHFSKKRLSMVTDDEFTIDAHKQIVMTTNAQTTINSPKIYLGAFGDEDEPMLLGSTSTYWMYMLCNWIIKQTDWMIELSEEWLAKHIHKEDTRGDKQMAPNSASIAQLNSRVSKLKELKQDLISLRDSLPTLLSDRVFTVGGGGSPGYDGGKLRKD